MLTRSGMVALAGYVALACLPTAAMPVFVGQYVEGFGYGLEAAGRASALENIGMALGQGIVLFLFTRPGVNLRRAAVASLVAFALAQVLSFWPGNTPLFLGARFLSGLAGGGILFATIGLYIASLPRPDRAYALYYGTLFVIGPLGLLLLPAAFAQFGARAVYLALAAAVLISLVWSKRIPVHREAGAMTAGGPVAAPVAHGVVAILLASLFIVSVGNGGVWIYLERIGADMGIAAGTREAWLGIGMACGVLGALAAAAVADRLDRSLSIGAGQVVLVGCYVLLLTGRDVPAFAAAAAALNVAVAFFTPFYLALLARCDATGRDATLGIVTCGLGYGAGPAILAVFLDGHGFTGALVAAAMMSVLSLLLLFVAVHRLRISIPSLSPRRT